MSTSQAAARLPLLGLTGLRDRLDERLSVLIAGARDAPARQQTLRATLEWSHSLLDPWEQVLFRRLGIFVGGFSLALAQRVVVDADGDPWSMLDRLGALVDKSLVVAEGEGAPRYRLLESARGELAQAEAAIRSGRALMVRGLGTAFALMMSLSLLAQRREKPELAARLFGCAEQAYSAGGHHMHPPEIRIRESVLGALRARFSEEEIATLLAKGARWSEDEAFERAGL